MRKILRGGAAALAAVVVFTMSMLLIPSNASAAADMADPSVHKIVKVAEGLTIPDTTFTFTATQYDEDTEEDGYQNPDGTTALAHVALDNVTVNFNGETSESTLEKTVQFDLSGITAPGEYTYEVAETDGGADHWTYDTQTYYMQVLVRNDGTKTYTITKTKGDTAAKEGSFHFTNEYKKYASLTVKKTVVNPEYEENGKYSFTITFADGKDADKISELDLSANNPELTKTDQLTYTFTLANDEELTINGIPAGTKYMISEAKPESKNYVSTKIEQTVNGSDSKITTSELRTINAQVIGEQENTAVYENTYRQVSPTGIIMNIAPYIAMIAIAAGLVALYLISRRRRNA